MLTYPVVGAEATVTVAVLLAADVTGALLNTATGSSDGGEPVVDSEEIPVGFRSDLTIAKSSTTTSVEIGDDVVWQIEVVNRGPSAATDVVVTDMLPASLTFVRSGSSAVCVAIASEVKCDIGELAVDESIVLDLVTQVAFDAEGESITNTASVDSPNSDEVPAVGAIDLTRPPEPEPPLAFTGDNIRVLVGYAVMFVTAGLILLIATRRRRAASH